MGLIVTIARSARAESRYARPRRCAAKRVRASPSGIRIDLRNSKRRGMLDLALDPLTLNQRVPGSSPGAPTIAKPFFFNRLRRRRRTRTGLFGSRSPQSLATISPPDYALLRYCAPDGGGPHLARVVAAKGAMQPVWQTSCERANREKRRTWRATTAYRWPSMTIPPRRWISLGRPWRRSGSVGRQLLQPGCARPPLKNPE